LIKLKLGRIHIFHLSKKKLKLIHQLLPFVNIKNDFLDDNCPNAYVGFQNFWSFFGPLTHIGTDMGFDRMFDSKNQILK